jgi:hypothetical protein
VLAFATSSTRAPLLGFKYLYPPFTLARQMSDRAGEVEDDEHYPTGVMRIMCGVGARDNTRTYAASTCFNVLRLPVYSSKEALRTKLLAAVTSKAGFEFS